MWLRTIHAWRHHKNLNACFSKTSTNRLLEGVSIYKAFDNLFSPANKSVQLWGKRELEIEGDDAKFWAMHCLIVNL